MECKFGAIPKQRATVEELIDTLWNVNPKKCFTPRYPNGELIDTLWNVNRIGIQKSLKPVFELIDTLWNVNLI